MHLLPWVISKAQELGSCFVGRNKPRPDHKVLAQPLARVPVKAWLRMENLIPSSRAQSLAGDLGFSGNVGLPSCTDLTIGCWVLKFQYPNISSECWSKKGKPRGKPLCSPTFSRSGRPLLHMLYLLQEREYQETGPLGAILEVNWQWINTDQEPRLPCCLLLYCWDQICPWLAQFGQPFLL